MRSKSRATAQTFDQLSQNSVTSGRTLERVFNRNQLESICTKLKPASISLVHAGRQTEPNEPSYAVREPFHAVREPSQTVSEPFIKVDCLARTVMGYVHEFTGKPNSFLSLLHQTKDLKPLCHNIHSLQHDKNQCPVREKWDHDIIMHSKDAIRKDRYFQRERNLHYQREQKIFTTQRIERQTEPHPNMLSCSIFNHSSHLKKNSSTNSFFDQQTNKVQISIIEQIEKDVPRSFEAHYPRSKFKISKLHQERIKMQESLSTVLIKYASIDPEVGYVQGMNLVCTAILTHLREPNDTFIFFRKLMESLRALQLNDFEIAKQHCARILPMWFKSKNYALFQILSRQSSVDFIFVSHYASLFSALVDMRCMHIIIDEYLNDGAIFLNRLLIAIVLFLEDDIIREDDAITVLSNTYIKEKIKNWQDIIQVTMLIRQ